MMRVFAFVAFMCLAAAFVVLCLLVLAFMTIANAHDGDPAHDAWYGSLYNPNVGMSCCNKQDCKPTASRIGAGGAIEVLIDQRYPGVMTSSWQPVPWDAIVSPPEPNPTGSAVACWYHNRVLCFTPKGAGT